jgi:hypothetical protein
MTTYTGNPQTGGGGANITCDGHVTSGYGASMTIAHNTATGDGNSVVETTANIRALNNASGTYLGRLYFTFDTSTIPAGAAISSAKLSLFGSATAFINQSSTSAVVCGSNQATANTLANSDFGQALFTAFCTPIALASLNQAAYNDFVFNATGIAAINKGGVTKLVVMTEVDRAITTITTQDNIMSFIMSDNGSNKPVLTVVYTVGLANLKSYNTNLKANVKSINTNPIANVKSLDTNV